MLRQSVRTMHVKAIKMRWLTGGLNYSYLLSTEDRRSSWLIDPAEAAEVIPQLNDDEVHSIKAIVNTHHHYDHSGGNVAMSAFLKQKGNYVNKVIAGSEKSPLANDIPPHLGTYKLGNLDVLCIRTPCHTQDSTCFYVRDPETKQQAVFTGDTLFNGGCGRFFEGSAEDMNNALNERLLDHTGESNWDNIKVYSGHEYTPGNVTFIRDYIYMKPKENESFDKFEAFTKSHDVTAGQFSIADELSYNPFMRLDDPIVRRQVGDPESKWSHVQVMQKLREMKNKA